jgi:hypothetical protein
VPLVGCICIVPLLTTLMELRSRRQRHCLPLRLSESLVKAKCYVWAHAGTNWLIAGRGTLCVATDLADPSRGSRSGKARSCWRDLEGMTAMVWLGWVAASFVKQ